MLNATMRATSLLLMRLGGETRHSSFVAGISVHKQPPSRKGLPLCVALTEKLRLQVENINCFRRAIPADSHPPTAQLPIARFQHRLGFVICTTAEVAAEGFGRGLASTALRIR